MVATAARPRADDTVDRQALETFAGRYGDCRLGPVCVVIPAYEEERTIGAVIDAVPERVCGLATSVLVVVDGGTDATEEVSAAHGAHACACRVNRGQGAALRLGYRLASERGATFVVTVDADGQWDPAETERLVKPLVDGEADFVQGSRRLGWAANEDRVRAAGVLFFAWLVNLLTGARVTDTSSGFRAFHARVVGDITLLQDQYQSSELLIEVLSRGYRVAERPVTMRARHSGHSKKGGNIAYGARYAGVILTTWWRVRGSGPAR
ncbi:MAG: glycosyltransferase family 2 protein [Acidimicrobiales bacterium]